MDDFAAPQADQTCFWCKECGGELRMSGGTGLPPESRKLVHTATGHEHGQDGHDPRPTSVSPELHAEATRTRDEFGTYFLVSDALGKLRAWLKPELKPDGAVTVVYEGRNADELRPQLAAAVRALVKVLIRDWGHWYEITEDGTWARWRDGGPWFKAPDAGELREKIETDRATRPVSGETPLSTPETAK